MFEERRPASQTGWHTGSTGFVIRLDWEGLPEPVRVVEIGLRDVAHGVALEVRMSGILEARNGPVDSDGGDQ